MSYIMPILNLLGALALFLFGMTTMSQAIQKVAGDKLRSFLSSMTSNTFKRILTGTLVTAVIQSSSATTVMIVGFVNAGMLTLTEAMGLIMGADIGTTATAWFLALLGFSSSIGHFALPIIAVGFVLLMLKSKTKKSIGELIIGFALLFLALGLIQNTVADTSIMDRATALMNNWQQLGFGAILLCVLIGAILTMIIQSSSAVMALTLVMCCNGLSIELGAALVLGENIGTTITAILAATVANTAAKRAAAGHAIFNIFGVIWVLILFHPFLWIVTHIISSTGLDNPMMAGASSLAIACSLALFHTLFNVTNTCLMTGFTKQLIAITGKIYKGKEEEEVYRLQYIQSGPLATPELSLAQADSEILHFVQICREQYSIAYQCIREKSPAEFEKLFSELEHYEVVTDKMEGEIGNYLNNVADGYLSEESSRRVQAMFKIIGELESIGDSGLNIGRIIERRNAHGVTFDTPMLKKIGYMMDLLFKGFDAIETNLKIGYENLSDISNAQDIEQEINEYRNNLKEEHLLNLESNQYSYTKGVFYMDMISEMERTGDFMINISEAVMEIK